MPIPDLADLMMSTAQAFAVTARRSSSACIRTSSWRSDGRSATVERVRLKSVTYVSGISRNPCVQNGPDLIWLGRLDSNQG